MFRKTSTFLPSLLVLVVILAARLAIAQTSGSAPESFSFISAGDMRSFTGPAPAGKRYFDGACEALKTIGAGSFMISPGDCDPPGPIRAVLDRYLGKDYIWYPVVGNHDAAKPTNLVWLCRWADAGIPNLVRKGPTGAECTMYSFDFSNSHFAVVNDYFDTLGRTRTTADVTKEALSWLEDDLKVTKKPLIWVVGHPPIESMPDMDTGRQRHGKESVSKDPARVERFVKLLNDFHVRAYLCGHTHDTSVTKVKGIWQADSGHARGGGDLGAPSTFLKFRVSGMEAWVDVYRADPSGQHYKLRKTFELN